MDGRMLLGAVAAVSVGAWGLGCERDDASKTTAAAGGGLARPLYPRCGTTGFARPVVTRLDSGGERGGSTWSLQFNRAQPAARPRADQTTTVVVVESGPANFAPERGPGVRTHVIAGRRLSVRPPLQPGGSFTARLKTSRASYAVLANGKGMDAIRRFVPCLP